MRVAGLRRAVGFGLMIAALAACGGGLKAMTSGQIGCAEKDVQIIDKHTGWSEVTWTAECHGKRFYCSSFSTGIGEAASSQINCKEAVAGQVQPSAAPAAPDQTAGCRYDTQCKGDRVCVKGECVAPDRAPPVAPPASSPPATPSP